MRLIGTFFNPDALVGGIIMNALRQNGSKKETYGWGDHMIRGIPLHSSYASVSARFECVDGLIRMPDTRRMAFRVDPPEKVPLQKRRAIRRAIQERIIKETAARHGEKLGQCVSTPEGYVIELAGKRRVPVTAEDQAVLAHAFQWERTGEGPAPMIRQ